MDVAFGMSQARNRNIKGSYCFDLEQGAPIYS